MHKGIGLTVAVALTAVVGTGSANAADKIKLGFFSTLEGTYTTLGEDGQRGFDLAVMQHNNKAGGKELDKYRERMLSDKRLRNIVDYPKLYEGFPGVKIRGGIFGSNWYVALPTTSSVEAVSASGKPFWNRRAMNSAAAAPSFKGVRQAMAARLRRLP